MRNQNNIEPFRTINQNLNTRQAILMFTNKFKIKDAVAGQRERKKYERKFDTVASAINNMFHTRTINDVYSMNMIVQHKGSLMIQPNKTFIKSRLINIFTN